MKDWGRCWSEPRNLFPYLIFSMTDSFVPNGANANRHSPKDKQSYVLAEEAFVHSPLRTFDKLEAFPRFVPKRSLARFLVKHELFQKILTVNGSIIECGVFNGAGLFSWAQLSSIYEPTNHSRKIIWFDTFEWFPSVHEADSNSDKNHTKGDLLGDTYESFSQSIEKVNSERYLGHIPSIQLVKGDFIQTSEQYVQENPHLLVALIYLDFDLYEPTKKALEMFLPRMSKGSILCFDELNCSNFPGETSALLESLNLRDYSIKRFPTDPWISYIVL